LIGGLLKGTKPVKYIYVDEAGTSAHEPVTVVVGVIVDADRQWVKAETALKQVLKSVPKHYRDGFIFHAKSVWGDKKYRDGWEFRERLQLIKSVAAIPRAVGIPISLAKIRRDADTQEGLASLKVDMSLSQWQHYRAFLECVQVADGYIRKSAQKDEVATVIAEDVPEMRRNLKHVLWVAKNMFLPFIPGHVWGIERIRDSIHFADKDGAPLLQIADACAFSFRRFFAEESYGEEFLEAVIGGVLAPEDWKGPMSTAIFDYWAD
jgi:hypothetical protein